MVNKKKLKRRLKKCRRTRKSLNADIQSYKALSVRDKVGVAFAGGGFRAHSVHTGVVSSLLPVGKNLKEVFANIDQISSNSGGSWFCGQAIYSKIFADVLTKVGHQLTYQQAASVYNNEYIVHVKNQFPVAGLDPDYDEDDYDFSGVFTLLAELKYALSHNMSWRDFVKRIVQGPTPDLAHHLETSLNDIAPQFWATGKIWSIQGGVGTWTQSYGDNDYGMMTSANFDGSVLSLVNNTRDTPYKFEPLSFNVAVGHSVTESPYAGVSKSTQNTSLQYSMKKGDQYLSATEAPSKTPFIEWSDKDSDKVTPWGALTTSSAAGAFLSLRAADSKPTLAHKLARMASHFSANSDAASAFKISQPLLDPTLFNQDHLDNIAEKRVCIGADGASVDGAAVSTLVRNGLDNIISIIDVNGVSEDHGLPKQYQQLFQPDTGSEAKGFEPISVFSEDIQTAKSLYEQHISAPLNPGIFGKLSKLNSIRYGTIPLITRDSQAWGVTGGRQINLHLIVVDCNIGMGGIFWDSYGHIVGQIRHLIRKDKKANSTIKGWFGVH